MILGKTHNVGLKLSNTPAHTHTHTHTNMMHTHTDTHVHVHDTPVMIFQMATQ